ncbi:MAG TPA: hypothetical protein VJU77_14775 [Chthoniobacterales bacterium]|nr:hypothetical protein [Chthoniobacterales bacterium]
MRFRDLIIRSSFAAACLVAGLVPLRPVAHGSPPLRLPEWPTGWDGREIWQIPLSGSDERFGENFPGRIAKFTDGRREFIFRWVTIGTRQLHPSADCFRGAGFTITPRPAFRDREERQWSSFLAGRDQRQLIVRERIADRHGHEWTDVSSWFWSVAFGQTQGPWLSVTVVEADVPP